MILATRQFFKKIEKPVRQRPTRKLTRVFVLATRSIVSSTARCLWYCCAGVVISLSSARIPSVLSAVCQTSCPSSAFFSVPFWPGTNKRSVSLRRRCYRTSTNILLLRSGAAMLDFIMRACSFSLSSGESERHCRPATHSQRRRIRQKLGRLGNGVPSSWFADKGSHETYSVGVTSSQLAIKLGWNIMIIASSRAKTKVFREVLGGFVLFDENTSW